MESYFNTVIIIVCFIVFIQFLEPWILQFFSTELNLSDHDMEHMVETVNKMSQKKLTLIHSVGTLIAVAIMMLIVIGLMFPLVLTTGSFYQHWPDFVLHFPSLIWLLGLIPGILLAGLVGNYIATKLARLLALPFMSIRSSRFLEFMGSGSVRSDGSYVVEGKTRSFQRYTTLIMLGLYLLTLMLFYLTADVLTTTHYHQRGIIPWSNQKIPHEQLAYAVDKDSGHLEVSFSNNGKLLKSIDLLDDSEAAMKKTLTKIQDKTTATLVYQ